MAVKYWTQNHVTFYTNISSPTYLTASGATTTIKLPAISLKANDPYWGDVAVKQSLGLGCYYNAMEGWQDDWNGNPIEIVRGSTTLATSTAHSTVSGGVANNTYATSGWRTNPQVNTSALFDSNNANSKTVTLKLIAPYNAMGWHGISANGTYSYNTARRELADIVVTLNVPPTVSVGTPTYSAPQYTGLGAYTVPITSAEAYYGGDISKVTLTVGQDSTVQTYSASSISNETISVTPTIAGTYTPTITVEDSRGQTKTVTMPQITVNPYLAPSLDFDVFRSNSSGVKDDEGEYGLITANVSFTDAIADLVAPIVKINGVITNDVTWYSTYSTSVGVLTPIASWSSVSSGDTIYGLVDGSFEQEDSYTISVTLTDSLGGSSAEITQTLSTAFYTIDFQAGGKEIAFGAPANDDLTNYSNGLFKCDMDAQFNGSMAFGSTVMSDFVVDQGTSGMWTYRKWNSGVAEAWVSNLDLGSQTPSVWVSPIRYKDMSNIALPTGVFTNTPTVTAVSATNQWWVVDINATSATSATARFATLTSSSVSIVINVYVYGTWK